MYLFFKKYAFLVGVTLTILVALFPGFFKMVGQTLSTFILNYWLQCILILICILLLIICNLCLSIKRKQNL